MTARQRFAWWWFATTGRTINRVLDLWGWLQGYCMATCWQSYGATFQPGNTTWRCWVRRDVHRATHGPRLWHRRNGWRWRPGGIPERADADPWGHAGPQPSWAHWYRTVPRRAHLCAIEADAGRTMQDAVNRMLARQDAIAGRSEMCRHAIPKRSCPECSPPARIERLAGWGAGGPDLGDVKDALDQAARDVADVAHTQAPIVDMGGGWRWRRTQGGGYESAGDDDLMNLADALAGEHTTDVPVEFDQGGPVLPPHLYLWIDAADPRIPTQRKDEPQ